MTSSGYSVLPKYIADSSARDAWLEIDLNSLEFNLYEIKAILKEKAEEANRKIPRVMAAVKADAYGHGATAISEVLAACGVDWLGVASATEGSELREANCKLPILVLSPTPSWAVKKAIEQNLDLTISSISQLQDIVEVLKDNRNTAGIHLKVDTGMHRLGMNGADFRQALQILHGNKQFKLVSIFSHLAKAGDSEYTSKQNEKFEEFIAICRELNCEPDFYHLASSEAAQKFSDTHYDLVRIGINLYGLEAREIAPSLIPIMSVRGRINQINIIDKGESVGYGLTWKAHRKTRLANIPIGYADGIDRGLSNRMKGLLHNKFIDQVGVISMDQMLFDITDVPEGKEGDIITLIGTDDYSNSSDKDTEKKKNALHLADWADELDTITYELACRLKARLARIYTRNKFTENWEKSSAKTTKKGK